MNLFRIRNCVMNKSLTLGIACKESNTLTPARMKTFRKLIILMQGLRESFDEFESKEIMGLHSFNTIITKCIKRLVLYREDHTSIEVIIITSILAK